MSEETRKNIESREDETREEKTARKPWAPPQMLETPEPPEGYHYRWIRAEYAGHEDRKNIMSRTREGYELVKSDEIGDFELPSMEDGKHAGVVAVGGLLLAKVPTETRDERNAYFTKRANDQMRAVDNDLMRESHPSMPILKPERQSKVTFGGASNKG
jgi:hypothetical protein